MTGKERRFLPRIRNTRPLGESLTQNAPPKDTLPTPLFNGIHWVIPSPLAQRLHQKSGIGRLDEHDSIHLTLEEVLFIHWHRHVPLPDNIDFVHSQLESSSMLRKVIAMEHARNGGEVIVPVEHVQQRFTKVHPSTWCLHWQRDLNWKTQLPTSSIQLQSSMSDVDWSHLIEWYDNTIELGQSARICVIDGELDVTSYQMHEVSPTGVHFIDKLGLPESLVQLMQQTEEVNEGIVLRWNGDWPLPSIGIEHVSARYLRREEVEFFKMDLHEQGSQIYRLYEDLIQRGLLLRPGFKYGTRWRAYEKLIDQEHAPWLIQPIERAGSLWEDICLSVRLAESVNKRWVFAFVEGNQCRYICIERSSISSSQ